MTVAESWKEPLLSRQEALLWEVETGISWKETTGPNDNDDDNDQHDDHHRDHHEEKEENPPETAQFGSFRTLLRTIESIACFLHQEEYDDLVMYLILPGLLWVQFTVALISWEEQQQQQQQQQPERPAQEITENGFWTAGGHGLTITWSQVNGALAWLVLSSYLYRHTLGDMMPYRQQQQHTGIALLLPEMFMDAVLVMLLWQGLVAGYLTLLFCTLSLAGWVLLLNIYQLVVLLPRPNTRTSAAARDDQDFNVMMVQPHSSSSSSSFDSSSSSSSTLDDDDDELEASYYRGILRRTV